jgi:hypothetical protein
VDMNEKRTNRSEVLNFTKDVVSCWSYFSNIA